MREQPSLFIKMSPVMAAKLTMCFGEQSWLDKSLRGRRSVWSTPIHLYRDLPSVGHPPLTGTPRQHLHSKHHEVVTDGVQNAYRGPKRKQAQAQKASFKSTRSRATDYK